MTGFHVAVLWMKDDHGNVGQQWFLTKEQLTVGANYEQSKLLLTSDGAAPKTHYKDPAFPEVGLRSVNLTVLALESPTADSFGPGGTAPSPATVPPLPAAPPVPQRSEGMHWTTDDQQRVWVAGDPVGASPEQMRQQTLSTIAARGWK